MDSLGSCLWCGVRLVDLEALRVNRMRMIEHPLRVCPGGPDTNIVAVTHIISHRRVAHALQWDRPFRSPTC